MQTRISAALVTLICGLALDASAQEYCVTCTEPDAKYRCTVRDEAGFTARTSRGQLLCISELARTGHHGSCSVGRTTDEPCEGELRTVMFPIGADAVPPPLAEPQPGTASPDVQDAQEATRQPPEPPAEGPPQTVEELAKQTVEASEKGLKKAGETVTDTAKSTGKAVGNAVSKTWNCLTTLFSDC